MGIVLGQKDDEGKDSELIISKPEITPLEKVVSKTYSALKYFFKKPQSFFAQVFKSNLYLTARDARLCGDTETTMLKQFLLVNKVQMSC